MLIFVIYFVYWLYLICDWYVPLAFRAFYISLLRLCRLSAVILGNALLALILLVGVTFLIHLWAITSLVLAKLAGLTLGEPGAYSALYTFYLGSTGALTSLGYLGYVRARGSNTRRSYLNGGTLVYAAILGFGAQSYFLFVDLLYVRLCLDQATGYALCCTLVQILPRASSLFATLLNPGICLSLPQFLVLIHWLPLTCALVAYRLWQHWFSPAGVAQREHWLARLAELQGWVCGLPAWFSEVYHTADQTLDDLSLRADFNKLVWAAKLFVVLYLGCVLLVQLGFLVY